MVGIGLIAVLCAVPSGIVCPADGTPCPAGCGPLEASAEGTAHSGVCCVDHAGHNYAACPTNNSCGARCVSAAPRRALNISYPIPMGMAGWQPLYPLCTMSEQPSLFAWPAITVPRGTNASEVPHEVPYFSSVGDLSSWNGSAPQTEPVTNLNYTHAVLVVHGSSRNADDYFCTIRAAVAALRARAAAPAPAPAHTTEGVGKAGVGAVAIVAPRFLEAADAPAARQLFWNMSFPMGNWKGGGESSSAAATSSTAGPGKSTSAMDARTVSSFDVLEQLLAAVIDRRRFPLLEHVTVVGHSAGGQTVHRFALASRFSPPPGVQLRFVVSNPSTYTYFDDRRWNASAAGGAGAFVPMPAEVESACPDAGQYFYQLAGNVPPFVARSDPRELITNYMAKDVWYLPGNNDTCNEDEIAVQGCDSHGLDRSCGAMAQGRFRRERAQHYFEYVRAYDADAMHKTDAHTGQMQSAGAQQANHKLVLVENVGHDHTLVFLSRVGLAAIFDLGMDIAKD